MIPRSTPSPTAHGLPDVVYRVARRRRYPVRRGRRTSRTPPPPRGSSSYGPRLTIPCRRHPYQRRDQDPTSTKFRRLVDGLGFCGVVRGQHALVPQRVSMFLGGGDRGGNHRTTRGLRCFQGLLGSAAPLISRHVVARSLRKHHNARRSCTADPRHWLLGATGETGADTRRSSAPSRSFLQKIVYAPSARHVCRTCPDARPQAGQHKPYRLLSRLMPYLEGLPEQRDPGDARRVHHGSRQITGRTDTR